MTYNEIIAELAKLAESKHNWDACPSTACYQGAPQCDVMRARQALEILRRGL